jgi:hypothetical protein
MAAPTDLKLEKRLTELHLTLINCMGISREPKEPKCTSAARRGRGGVFVARITCPKCIHRLEIPLLNVLLRKFVVCCLLHWVRVEGFD